MFKFYSGHYILSEYKDTSYSPLKGLLPKKSFICCLIVSITGTMYSEVSFILMVRNPRKTV